MPDRSDTAEHVADAFEADHSMPEPLARWFFSASPTTKFARNSNA